MSIVSHFVRRGGALWLRCGQWVVDRWQESRWRNGDGEGGDAHGD
jgi:hypothetical protein